MLAIKLSYQMELEQEEREDTGMADQSQALEGMEVQALFLDLEQKEMFLKMTLTYKKAVSTNKAHNTSKMIIFHTWLSSRSRASRTC